MKTFSHLWQYLAEFFLEWEKFQSCRENRNTHEDVEKYGGAREATDNILGRMRFACWVRNATRGSARTYQRARVPPHTHASPRALSGAHTHPEMCNTCCFSTARMISLTLFSVTLYVHCLVHLIIFTLFSHSLAHIPSGKYFQELLRLSLRSSLDWHNNLQNENILSYWFTSG